MNERSKVDSSEGLDYARALYELVLNWYRNADLKAQVLLTLDGVFLAFLIDSIFTKPEQASKLFASFTTLVWLLLVALCVCLAGSIVSALLCLWSRLYPPWRISSVLESEGVRRGDGQTYPQESLGFFQFIGHFQHDQYRERLKTLDHEVELAILAFQLVEVSKNVTRKHLLVDCGFLFAGLSLFFFLLAGGLYVWIL